MATDSPNHGRCVSRRIAHTLITEQLLDEALVNRYCVGYDRSTLPDTAAPNDSYKDYVLGTGDDGIAKTPEWAADITGIPATRIRQLAREIASARACYICRGWGRSVMPTANKPCVLFRRCQR